MLSDYACAKCRLPGDKMIVEGGVGYIFCKSCGETLEKLPTSTIQGFIGTKKETWVAKNMREARERRAAGKGLWNNG
jgi:hypothetical protein